MSADQRIALVTGANKGIGRHIAHQLALAGCCVYLGSRDATRGESAARELAAEGLDVRAVVLDVTDTDTLAAVASRIADDAGHLDALVNNAGISTGFEAPSRVRLEDVRATFETNVFGVVATTNAMLDLLRAARRARIVNVSSGLGSITVLASQVAGGEGLNALAYQASKAALNLVTVAYAKELLADGIAVNAVSPGYRRTDLGGGNAPMPGAGDPAEGAAIAVQMALAGDDAPTGGYFSDSGAPLSW